jgi:hypothetical protein
MNSRGWTAPLALAALAFALAVHVELLARLRRVDTHNPPWWFGYARDGANLSTALMLWGAYLMIGYLPAVALCAAMLTTLATYLLDWAVARVLKLRHVRLALALPLAAWVTCAALFSRAIGSALSSLIAAVQPR